MFDYHIHTVFSKDSRIGVEEAVERALELGIKEIAITDHAELNVWRPGDIYTDDMFDMDIYIEKLQAVQKQYGDRISVKIGIEMGLQWEEQARIGEIINGYPFDFVIGSSHTIDRQDLYYKQLFRGKTKEAAYEKYFNEVLKIVKSMDAYSVYGHLDLVRRYAFGEYEDIALSEKEYEMIREILKHIIEKGKGIEINTSGFRYGIGTTNPSLEVLEIYKELGGQIITVGSDAHKIEQLGYGILDAYEVLKGLGYQYITTFNQREPQFIKLI